MARHNSSVRNVSSLNGIEGARRMSMRSELIAATALALLMFALATGGRAGGGHARTGRPFAGVEANTATGSALDCATM